MLKKFCFSTPKFTSKLTYNTKLHFFLRKNEKVQHLHLLSKTSLQYLFRTVLVLSLAHTKKRTGDLKKVI